MIPKKHDWVDFTYSNNLIIEIKILDINARRKIDFFRCNTSEELKKILYLIKNKYNYG